MTKHAMVRVQSARNCPVLCCADSSNSKKEENGHFSKKEENGHFSKKEENGQSRKKEENGQSRKKEKNGQFSKKEEMAIFFFLDVKYILHPKRIQVQNRGRLLVVRRDGHNFGKKNIFTQNTPKIKLNF